MKNIYKNKKAKIITFGLALMCAVSVGFFLQGCSQDDDFVDDAASNNNAKYLDLDVTNTNTKFTKTELNTIGDAINRIADHMVFDNDSNKYVFNLQSPAEINVSERLFDYIYPNIHINTSNTPRLKGDYEFYNSPVETQYSMALSDAEAMDLFNSMMTGTSIASYVKGVVTAVMFGSNTIAAASALPDFLENINWTNQYNAYINAGYRKGIVLTNTCIQSGVNYIQLRDVTYRTK